MKIYMGYDRREKLAYDVAEFTLKRYANRDVQVTPLNIANLESAGLMYRVKKVVNGQIYDAISNAPMSTEFAISRFLTPLLAQSGWALFVDSDVVFLDDVTRIMEHADAKYAVMCVKHPSDTGADSKMDGQVQTYYHRKNWSSVMLFNCDHPANRLLDLTAVNSIRGLSLHSFYWLKDEQIGELPAKWNWLVNVRPMPEDAMIAHFTLGGPWFNGWPAKPYDSIWSSANSAYQSMVHSAQV